MDGQLVGGIRGHTAVADHRQCRPATHRECHHRIAAQLLRHQQVPPAAARLSEVGRRAGTPACPHRMGAGPQRKCEPTLHRDTRHGQGGRRGRTLPQRTGRTADADDLLSEGRERQPHHTERDYAGTDEEQQHQGDTQRDRRGGGRPHGGRATPRTGRAAHGEA